MTIQNINARPSFKGYISTNVLNIMKDIEEKTPNGNPPEAIEVLDTFRKKLPADIGLDLMEEESKHQGEFFININESKKIFIEDKVVNKDGITDYDKFLKVFTSLTLQKMQALINTKKEG